MGQTIVQRLANYTHATRFEQLPHDVVGETKRILLDSIGCALAGTEFKKGRAGIDFARVIGEGKREATIIGDRSRVSIPAAAFANAELINAIDMDVVTFPGHVAPAVLSGVMAVGEAGCSSGKAIIEALAVGHDIGNRFGKAMDNLRDTKDGESKLPAVFGYTSPIFGATAAVAKLRGHTNDVIANALGIAACISPVNSMMSWIEHAPAMTIKYTLKGALALQAVTASYMAEFGHRGDLRVLDDVEFGYPRFIGTTKWAPESILENLGSQWRFPAETSYKPYPHCRVFNALLDCVTKAVEDNDISTDEIEEIKIFVEGFAQKPVWVNRAIEDVHDAQFSMYHGIAVAAHRIPPGKAWLDRQFIVSKSVMDLMAKVTSNVHPEYVKLLTGHAASRPARVEISARGHVFVEEKRFPKGSRSPDPDTFMTDAELIAKFRHNADGMMPDANVDALVAMVTNLEDVSDFSAVMKLTS
jgi:2-methylcitrate dehydratase PrpD